MVPEFTIRSATPDDIDALRVLVPDAFTERDVMSVHLKTPKEAFLSLYDAVTQDLDFCTSMVAVTPSGDIVACFISAAYDAPFDPSNLHPLIMPALSLIRSLDSWFDSEFKHTSSTKVLHFLFGATKSGFEGKGISKRLRAAALEQAREAGWEIAVVECVTPVTQHLMRDVYGFTVGKEIIYDDVEYEGTRPFKGMKGSAMLLYKVLG